LLLSPPPILLSRFPYTTLFRSVGRHRTTVGEGGLGVELEHILGVARPLPRRGESGLDLEVLVDSRERLVHEPLHHPAARRPGRLDRKSTRLNSSHVSISYAVFC